MYWGFWRCVRSSILIPLIASVFSPAATAQNQAPVLGQSERLGILEIREIFLEPRFRYYETRSGEFDLGNSLIGFQWIRDDVISAVLTAGARDLVSRPRFYRSTNESDFTLIEAFIQADSIVGNFRFGRVPLPYGLESGRGEAILRLPRSLIFSQQWLGLRDQGLAYEIEFHGFSSEWAVHNGEGGENLDNQIWFTSRWAWSGGAGVLLGFSGATGRTTPMSTMLEPGSTAPPRTLTEAGIDPTQSSKIRFGNLFFEYEKPWLSLAAEGHVGEFVQNSEKTRLRGGHADVRLSLNRTLSLLARWDVLDPNDRLKDDRLQQATLGFSVRGLYDTSTIYILASRSEQQGQTQPTHEGWVIWRLAPYARGPR